MNSPGHRANILNGGYTEVGFGFINIADYKYTDAQGHPFDAALRHSLLPCTRRRRVLPCRQRRHHRLPLAVLPTGSQLGTDVRWQ